MLDLFSLKMRVGKKGRRETVRSELLDTWDDTSPKTQNIKHNSINNTTKRK